CVLMAGVRNRGQCRVHFERPKDAENLIYDRRIQKSRTARHGVQSVPHLAANLAAIGPDAVGAGASGIGGVHEMPFGAAKQSLDEGTARPGDGPGLPGAADSECALDRFPRLRRDIRFVVMLDYLPLVVRSPFDPRLLVHWIDADLESLVYVGACVLRIRQDTIKPGSACGFPAQLAVMALREAEGLLIHGG